MQGKDSPVAGKLPGQTVEAPQPADQSQEET
jgi:hypothetical protein